MFHNLDIEITRARTTRQKLSGMLHITPTTLSLKLNGKYELTLKECKGIKKALNSPLSLDELFEEDEENIDD